MIRKFLNRLFGRTDSITDAINSYVGGNASADETSLVEQMMRDDPALEKDLATQRAMLGVLGKIGRIEAPRSFAITPEMVAAAEGSQSGISKFAELFAPQRKFAMAPAVLAGFAALTVALLTIGDLAGVIEQSRGGDSSASAVAVESAAAPAATPAPASVATGGLPESDTASTAPLEAAGAAIAEPETTDAAAAPAATSAPPAGAPRALDSGITAGDSSAVGEAQDADAPSSLAAAPPQNLESADAKLEIDGDGEVAKRGEVIPEDLEESAAASQLQEAVEAVPETESIAGVGIGADIGEGAGEGAAAGTAKGAATGAGDGIELPLWQLQIALAAIALAAIGAWAGLRRARGE